MNLRETAKSLDMTILTLVQETQRGKISFSVKEGSCVFDDENVLEYMETVTGPAVVTLDGVVASNPEPPVADDVTRFGEEKVERVRYGLMGVVGVEKMEQLLAADTAREIFGLENGDFFGYLAQLHKKLQRIDIRE